MAKRDSSLLQNSMAVSFIPLQPTLGIVLGNSFHEAPNEQLLCWLASRSSLELSRECCNQGQTVFTHFSGTVLWACVAYHFTITALTIDRGSSSRAEIWSTDLLERRHPMPVPRWDSVSSFIRPFYCQCLSMEIAWLCARFYTAVSNGCGWNSWIH
jgi:hypothetical protein